MNTKEKITKLLKNKDIAKKETKILILAKLDKLNEEQLNTIKDKLEDTAKTMKEIDIEYEKKETPLKMKFLNVLNNSESAAIARAISLVEKNEDKKKNEDLESLMKKIDE